MAPTLPFASGSSGDALSGRSQSPFGRSPFGDRPGGQAPDEALTDALARLGAGRELRRQAAAGLGAATGGIGRGAGTLVAGIGADDQESRDAVATVAADQVITAVRRIPAAAASYAPFPEAVDPRLVQALRKKGVEQLYTHQAEAMTHALAGRHVVVITPTASGKTLCYNGPILSAILEDLSARALYLFPTKALAQDQLAELHSLAELLAESEAGAAGDESGVATADAGPHARGPEIGVFTYDGDTPQDARRAIRTRAHIVLSNPDMLHAGILPHHPRWAKLFENLRYVVIDELHAYRGVFGSHLANILRRLHRVCRHYGSNPVFVCTSATIANPVELAERLTERRMELVETSGAPRAEKFFLFLNPPVVNQQLGIRRSYLAETRRVALEFLKRKLQLIVFAQSRLSTEILTTYLKDACESAPGTPEMVRGYRGGYLPLRRREIERGLRDGSVRAVVSTSALELGIDIGALDVSVMAGYPGTIAATWQRAGRAGRRAGRSAAVLVASSAPLDQFIIRHPAYFFGSSPEHALINPDNLQILLDHVKCAAFELPFTAAETFGREDVQQVLAVLGEEGFVHQADAQWNWTHESYPADAVSLRSVSSDNFVIVDTTHGTKVIGETDFTSGPSTLHEKAIYLIEGQLFQVEKLDFEGRKAYVRGVDCDYYTDAITYTKVTILETFESAETCPATDITGSAPASGSHGEVHVVSRVVGFKKIRFYTNENVGSGELDLPEQQMHTTSYWLTMPSALVSQLPYGTDDRRDGINGAAYAMKNVAQLLLMCDRQDIGLSVDTGSLNPQTAAPAHRGRNAVSAAGDGGADASTSTMVDPHIFIYDNYPGGIGFSAPLFRMQSDLLAKTHELVTGCPCEVGCPSCVGPIGETGPLAKRVALELLQRVIGTGGVHDRVTGDDVDSVDEIGAGNARVGRGALNEISE
jgi:DEAD/DEAH box helicase domain-containing protein